MSTKVDLEFHDSGGDDVLFDQSSSQTHTFHNFPESAVDDDDTESGDKSQLLKGEESKKSPSFWTFEYYQQFFDVETRQVFHRVTGSMIPIPKKNYLEVNIRPNPDLYGPFWICTTLVFTTAIAGNLANYLSSAGKDYHWKYDFHKVTFAATAIFSYWWFIPALIYGVLWWRKSQAGYTFLEILCVYGYSLAIYIPISILWVINIAAFKWILVIVGAVLSGGVLVITFWPAVKDDTKNVAFAFIGLVFLLHLGLAAGFLLYFFHVPPQTSTTPASDIPSAPSTPKPLKTEKLSPLSNKPETEESNPASVGGDTKGSETSKTHLADNENANQQKSANEKHENTAPVQETKGKPDENTKQNVKREGSDKHVENVKEKIKRNAVMKLRNRQIG